MPSEKLLIARGEIQEVLKRHDIAGFVVLHAPGHLEIFIDLMPSYSKVIEMRDAEGNLVAAGLRSKVEDYGGDRAAQRADLESTLGMVSGMAEAMAHNAIPMLELAQQFDKATGAEHTPLVKEHKQ